ncbi:aldehyde dehydrogenase (NADP(+)) [Microbacterium sp. BK668]|uniref:aldehyde dehydrogenase (NADP(+)) n=1 Tax=Microbacterium sp. BK668 TaxID=2512118 RepID=UPI00106183A1|nr:aldehyde dehydrogenase (NADP(+)) [Microbacterium sp. BK668]TDN91557.1 NADP-dependent aldehyde dehydrogenase [Microbacterium sp. BK668]
MIATADASAAAADVDAALAGIDATARELRRQSPAVRARQLSAIADALEGHRAELVAIAAGETNLEAARLNAELTRTTNQLRMFGRVVTDSRSRTEVDPADHVSGTPDVRRTTRPVGPVAVFAAGNFPFAFGVAGGDTASALAAGCPVVVKRHPGHPRLSVRTAEIVVQALAGAGAPHGTFRSVDGFDAGVALVQHPSIRAAAFTGSTAGGRALFDLAASRDRPIPFYGELGSMNPVFLLPDAVHADPGGVADGLVESFTMGAGQYCTKPGLVFHPSDYDLAGILAERLADSATLAMLSASGKDRYLRAVEQVAASTAVRIASGRLGDSVPLVLTTSLDEFIADIDRLQNECFGPATLLIEYDDVAQLVGAARALEGSLTASIFTSRETDAEDRAARTGLTALLDELAELAGRIIFNGWPTGVPVGRATTHGGPYPSSTAVLHTSVGVHAIDRFLRPITYQNAPPALLPVGLRNGSEHEGEES